MFLGSLLLEFLLHFCFVLCEDIPHPCNLTLEDFGPTERENKQSFKVQMSYIGRFSKTVGGPKDLQPELQTKEIQFNDCVNLDYGGTKTHTKIKKSKGSRKNHPS